MENKKVYKKKKIDSVKYVNSETGEILSSESPNITSVNEFNPSLKIISSKEYVVVDSGALMYIASKFNNSDLANILKISNMVKGNYNILYKERIPHTSETLREELDYSLNKFRDFLKRLYKEGIISYLLSCINGIDHKFIVLNPNVARKQKTYHVDCLNLFKEFELKAK